MSALLRMTTNSSPPYRPMTSDCRSSAWIGANDRAQAGIACRVSKGVVDLFEVIEIDEQERDRQSTRPRAQAGGIQTLDERAAIQHARERIGLRPALGFGKGRTLLAQPIGNSQAQPGWPPRPSRTAAHNKGGARRARPGRASKRMAVAMVNSFQHPPGDQEPTGGAVAPPPGEKCDNQREDRRPDKHEIADRRDQAAQADEIGTLAKVRSHEYPGEPAEDPVDPGRGMSEIRDLPNEQAGDSAAERHRARST